MKMNAWKEAYEAPQLECHEVVVEAGFATSKEVGGTTGGWTGKDDYKDDDWQ